MTKTIHGKARGRIIELDEDLGIAEGQEVEVQVKVITPAGKWGQGMIRSAGIAADIPEFDAAFEQIERDRELAQFRDHAE